MKSRIFIGLFLLFFAVAPVVDELFFQHLRPEQMSGEDHFMGQFWAIVSPSCAALAVVLFFPALLRSTKGWLALVAVAGVLFAIGAWAMR